MRVKTRNARNPKVRNWTPEQEAEYKRFEVDMVRSRIMELGVAALLNADSYLNSLETGTAASVLQDAVALRKMAETGRSEIRRETEQERVPKAKAKRKPKPGIATA